MIEALIECCAGIDVGKKFVVVCLLTGPAQGDARSEIRKFSAENGSLETLRQWLVDNGCTHVVMESTGECTGGRSTTSWRRPEACA
jgi:transposase